MITKEFLIAADSEPEARRLCMNAIRSYAKKKKKKWRYRRHPATGECRIRIESQKYLGRNAKLRGKWRAYARIELL